MEFRKMRRSAQQLSNEKCIEILKREPRGVLAVIGDEDYPYALPLDFVYEEENGKIYFHCAKVGYKLDALRNNNKVSFCVYDEGFRKEGDWALNIKSIIIFGKIKFIEDQEETIERVRKLALKYYPTAEAVEEEIVKAGSRVQMLELTIEHMTGKLVNES
ncbi:MAG: pyridoxamine 5'-phosphate oxidase family protein [Peptoniphilus sp.]|uniref:pyridoxamine 5'-phosphate oxidase family protein n=1 Tax=Peptoniphilus sp. TaxID=1971214 RepID=UPI002A765F46|nr:pyridoxamine 5'-phosphate oxidase family protein [Peptoniphilus sp.]MDY2986002.1 pyridoxamine 5'-phosphate oxidase family protein [Peptoniphilus sp.]